MDPTLEALAVRNGGWFSRGDALSCGWNDRDLRLAVRAGIIRRLRQGAYSPRVIYDHLDEVGRHLVLARATLARQRGSAALTGVSAAAAHGLLLHGHNLDVVQLVRLDGGAARREVNARHHVVTDDVAASVVELDGLLVTNLARTVWEVAAHAGLEAGVTTADFALHRDPGLLEQLAVVREQLGFRPGSRRARMALDLADGRSESAGESLSRVLFFRQRVPMPEPQRDVEDEAGRVVGRVDFLWEDDRHVGEFDGKVKYGRYLRPGESPGDAVFREKRREDEVRAQGFGMTRWTWADLDPARSKALVARINADRARSRRLYASPGPLTGSPSA
jgi:hypothetical protein